MRNHKFNRSLEHNNIGLDGRIHRAAFVANGASLVGTGVSAGLAEGRVHAWEVHRVG